jgi:hypothetical protein
MLFLVRSLHKLLIKDPLTGHLEMNHDMVTNSVVIKECGVLISGPSALARITYLNIRINCEPEYNKFVIAMATRRWLHFVF